MWSKKNRFEFLRAIKFHRWFRSGLVYWVLSIKRIRHKHMRVMEIRVSGMDTRHPELSFWLMIRARLEKSDASE